MVRETIHNGTAMLPDGTDGLTIPGFLLVHTSFIQKGRLETTWRALRKFGYGEDLRLTEQFLLPKFDEVPGDCSVELSPLGYQFFTDIFEIFDKVSLPRLRHFIENYILGVYRTRTVL
jgi:EF hand associated